MKEIWKYIPEYGNKYQSSTFGRIKSLDIYVNSRYGVRLRKGKILKQQTDKFGYKRIMLYKNSKYKLLQVHRLIAITFINNSENKPCVNHLDGNKQNNSIENLEWCTYSENQLHKINVLEYKSGMYNKHHSEETKQKLSNINKGKKLSEEIKTKISKTSKGRVHSEKTKQKISNTRNKKIILQYSKDFILIKEWKSISEASICLNICLQNISKCCLNERKTAGKFIWKFK